MGPREEGDGKTGRLEPWGQPKEARRRARKDLPMGRVWIPGPHEESKRKMGKTEELAGGFTSGQPANFWKEMDGSKQETENKYRGRPW